MANRTIGDMRGSSGSSDGGSGGGTIMDSTYTCRDGWDCKENTPYPVPTYEQTIIVKQYGSCA